MNWEARKPHRWQWSENKDVARETEEEEERKAEKWKNSSVNDENKWKGWKTGMRDRHLERRKAGKRKI